MMVTIHPKTVLPRTEELTPPVPSRRATPVVAPTWETNRSEFRLQSFHVKTKKKSGETAKSVGQEGRLSSEGMGGVTMRPVFARKAKKNFS